MIPHPESLARTKSADARLLAAVRSAAGDAVAVATLTPSMLEREAA